MLELFEAIKTFYLREIRTQILHWLQSNEIVSKRFCVDILEIYTFFVLRDGELVITELEYLDW